MTPAVLLPYQHKIVAELCDPANSELLILARGLGLRRIICTLLQIFDSERNLVILVNATEEEAQGLGEELGILGVRKPGLRIVGHETPKKDR
jgi:DNA excision repair protein ERCC-4